MILQSLSHSGECFFACGTFACEILGLKRISEGYTDCKMGLFLCSRSRMYAHSSLLNAEFFIFKFIFYFQIQNLYNSVYKDFELSGGVSMLR